MLVKKSQSSTYLSRDSKVEVCSNEDGYKGAWFPAKILDQDPPIPATRRKRKSLSGSCSSSSSSATTKALVQYETLLSDDDPDKPLTELVEVGLIRPVPPSDIVHRPFEPGDKVDAFHLDAWWSGVVINLEEDEYTVGFLYPPDLLVKRMSDLRPHWDFADGVWVRGKKEMMMGPIFSPGTAVEMNPNEKILYYAWFPAIYLGQLGINSFLLQYKNSNNSDVKIVVTGHQIRPQPPQSDESEFSLLDKVDAFHDMGWWVGEITKVLKGNKYAVTLIFTRQEMEFSHSELRAHMHWNGWNDGGWATMIHERWITEFREFHFRRDSEVPSKHSCQSSRNYELLSCFGNSEAATPLRISGATKGSTEKKTPCSRISGKNQTKHMGPCTDKSPHGKPKKKLKMSQQPKDDATALSLSKKLKGGQSEDSLLFEKSYARRTPVKTSNKEFPVIDVVKIEKQKVGGLDDQALTHSKRKGSLGKKGSEIGKAGEVDVGDEHVMDNTESSGIRSESEATGGSHTGASCLVPMEGVEQNGDGVSSAVEGNGKLPALLVEYSKDPAIGEEHNGAGSIAADCTNEIFELPMITRLDLKGEKHNGTGVVAQVESTETQVVKDKGSKDAMVEEEAVHSAMDIDKGNPAGISKQQNEVRELVKTGVTGSEEAMRETETVNSTMNYATQEVQVAVTGVLPKTSAHDQPLSLCIGEMHSVKTIGNPAGTANQQNKDNGRQVETGVTGNPAGTANQQNEVHGRQVETGVTDEADTEQNNNAVRQAETVDSPMDCSTKELQVAVTDISEKASAHDQPFSSCTSEMHSVKPIEGTGNPAETANQQNEATGSQVETSVTVNIEQQDIPDLPFVKSYLEIWEKVESMDAFKRYPQKPHFHPLVKCGEFSRESLAIAKMLTFASLVEKTSKLKVEDPDDFFDSSCEELDDLETFGFYVKAVRDRLNFLLEMKFQLGQLQDKSKEVEIQITEQTHDRAKHNEIISGVAKQIKDLQDQLVVLMSEDAAKGSEISRLQSEANSITESIQSTHRTFEKLAEAW